MFLFTEDNLRHHMPIKHIISMFEQKVAKNFEEIVLLKGNIICFIKFTYNPIYICLKTGLCIEYGWFIRVFFYILIIYKGKIIKKNFKSKIYGKLTTIKVIILSFRLYLCSYSLYFFVWYCLFDEFCYINTDSRLLKLIIIDKFTIKIHMALEKYIKITLFLLNMKYLCNI